MSDPQLVGIGAIFIDDIVRPDGQTFMGRLGGGVTHALMGAALWGEHPGICAVMGDQLPAEAYDQIAAHCDVRGLRRLPLPQIRAWQIFEHDGTRRELYRVEITQPFTSGAQPQHLPDAYRTAWGFYLLQDCDGIRAWRAAISGFVLWEPLQQAMIPGSRSQLRAVLHDCQIDAISPNLAEAQAVYGELPPEKLIEALLDDGAQRVALRMGAAGSLVAERSSGSISAIPAVPAARIADQTGAGNTYCGGLLAGLKQGKSLAEAAAMGAVAASFCLEQIGVLDPRHVHPSERDRRLRLLVSVE